MTGRKKAQLVEQILTGVWHLSEKLTRHDRAPNPDMREAECGVVFSWSLQVRTEDALNDAGDEVGLPICEVCHETRALRGRVDL